MYSIYQMGSFMYNIQLSDFVGKILSTFENCTYIAKLTISFLISCFIKTRFCKNFSMLLFNPTLLTDKSILFEKNVQLVLQFMILKQYSSFLLSSYWNIYGVTSQAVIASSSCWFTVDLFVLTINKMSSFFNNGGVASLGDMSSYFIFFECWSFSPHINHLLVPLKGS